MSTEKPRKPFGYCRHGEHWKCPIIIDIIRVDGGGQYRKYFECGCECHTEEER